MLAVSTGNVVVDTVIGTVIIAALIVVWRVVITDRTIRKVRFGVFYERERDHDPDEEENP